MTKIDRRMTLIAVIWFAVVFGVAASGRLAQLRPPLPQIGVVALTLALMLTVLRVEWARAWAFGLPLRAIVAFHLTRAAAGGAFLYYHTQGQLPAAFALPAAWGDILVALLAFFLLMTVAPGLGMHHRIYQIWNLLGLVDILLVVANAARMAMADPPSMVALLKLPLSLLPTFLVPIVIVSHVVLGLRLRERA
jgi:hypothetical protein